MTDKKIIPIGELQKDDAFKILSKVYIFHHYGVGMYSDYIYVLDEDDPNNELMLISTRKKEVELVGRTYKE